MNASSEPYSDLLHTWTSSHGTVIKSSHARPASLSDEDKRYVGRGVRVEGQLAGEKADHWVVSNPTLDGKVLEPHLSYLYKPHWLMSETTAHEAEFAAPAGAPSQIQLVTDEPAEYDSWGVAAKEPEFEPESQLQPETVAAAYDYADYPATDHAEHYASTNYEPPPPVAAPAPTFVDSVKVVFRKLLGG